MIACDSDSFVKFYDWEFKLDSEKSSSQTLTKIFAKIEVKKFNWGDPGELNLKTFF